MTASKDNLSAYRRGVMAGVALGERIGRVEGYIRTIGATGAVDRVGAFASLDALVRDLRKATEAAESIRHGATMEDVE
jgi:hypothetical protein